MSAVLNNRTGISAFLTGILGGAAAVLLINSRISYCLYVPSAYRIIYIPLIFWIFLFCYIFATYLIFSKNIMSLKAYIKQTIFFGICLHVYMLLGGLIARLYADPQLLGCVYRAYATVVFCLFTMLIAVLITKGVFKNKETPMPILTFSLGMSPVCYFCLAYLAKGDLALSFFVLSFALAGIFLGRFMIDRIIARMKIIFSKEINVVLVIFVLAFTVRAFFGFTLVEKTTKAEKGYDGYLYASDDGLTYDKTAKDILSDPSLLKSGKIKLWSNWDQFYSVFLAIFYKLVGRNFLLLTIFQGFLGAFVPVCIYLIGKEIFNRATAMLAAFLLSLKGGLIMLSSYMGHEAVWLPLFCLLALLLTRYFKESKSHSYARDLQTGVIVGALSLFRSMYFYFIPFFLLWEICFYKRKSIKMKMLRAVLIGFTAFMVIISVFGYFKNTFHSANTKKAQNIWYASRLSPPFQYLGNERFDAIGVNFPKDFKGSIDAIAKEPFRFLNVAIRVYPLRMVAYFEAYQFGFFDPLYILNPAKSKNRFASSLEFYFTLFFLIGLVMSFSKKGVIASPVFMILVFHAIFFSILLSLQAPRLKEVSAPFVYLLGSFGVIMSYNFLNKKEER